MASPARFAREFGAQLSGFVPTPVEDMTYNELLQYARNEEHNTRSSSPSESGDPDEDGFTGTQTYAGYGTTPSTSPYDTGCSSVDFETGEVRGGDAQEIFDIDLERGLTIKLRASEEVALMMIFTIPVVLIGILAVAFLIGGVVYLVTK